MPLSDDLKDALTASFVRAGINAARVDAAIDKLLRFGKKALAVATDADLEAKLPEPTLMEQLGTVDYKTRLADVKGEEGVTMAVVFEGVLRHHVKEPRETTDGDTEAAKGKDIVVAESRSRRFFTTEMGVSFEKRARGNFAAAHVYQEKFVNLTTAELRDALLQDFRDHIETAVLHEAQKALFNMVAYSLTSWRDSIPAEHRANPTKWSASQVEGYCDLLRATVLILAQESKPKALSHADAHRGVLAGWEKQLKDGLNIPELMTAFRTAHK